MSKPEKSRKSGTEPDDAQTRMADIARLAQVSVATVSRALAGSPRVARQTRERIEAAVRLTGYTVNHAAQRLRLQETRQIFVVVPDISNAFFADMLLSIQEAAAAAGYSIVIGNRRLDREQEHEDEYARQLLTGVVDGMLYVDVPVPEMLCRPRYLGKIVAVAQAQPFPGVSTVQIDNVLAAREAVRHLVSLGHRRIAHLAGARSNPATGLRLQGFRDELAASGIAEDPALIACGRFTIESGGEMMGWMLQAPEVPTGVCCSSDEIAIGAIRAVKHSGRRVPDDVSVVGFDDLHIASAYDPALTTIRQPRARMGEAAVATLLQQLRGELKAAIDTVLPHTLVARASTGPVSPEIAPRTRSRRPARRGA